MSPTGHPGRTLGRLFDEPGPVRDPRTLARLAAEGRPVTDVLGRAVGHTLRLRAVRAWLAIVGFPEAPLWLGWRRRRSEAAEMVLTYTRSVVPATASLDDDEPNPLAAAPWTKPPRRRVETTWMNGPPGSALVHALAERTSPDPHGPAMARMHCGLVVVEQELTARAGAHLCAPCLSALHALEEDPS